MSPKVTQAHMENKRKEILDSAARVFVRLGYQAATMKDVVEESGLSRGGVYLYFSSTEEMLLALIEEMDRENDLQTEQLLREYGSAWSALDALLDHLLEELRHIRDGMIPVLFEAMMSDWRRQTFAELMNRRYKHAADRLEEMLRIGEERGELKPLLPLPVIVRMFVSFNDGLMVDAVQFGAELADAKGQIEAYRLSLRHILGVDARKGEQKE